MICKRWPSWQLSFIANIAWLAIIEFQTAFHILCTRLFIVYQTADKYEHIVAAAIAFH